MTEAEWLTTDDADAMYYWVTGYQPKRVGVFPKITRRLGSLYAVACVRATPQAASQSFLIRVADEVERSADANDWSKVDRLCREAGQGCADATTAAGLDSILHFWALAVLRLTEGTIETYAIHVPFFIAKALEGADNLPELHKIWANLLRDIAGNPFRGGRGREFDKRKRKPRVEPVFHPLWRTGTVLSLARAMYDSRDFSGMPILVDALQEAGCEDSEILNHCRDTSHEHARGCWVIDLILKKS